MSDLQLLRQFEPILRFNAGERFFPCPVDAYVARCSLWVGDRHGRAARIVPSGGLDLDRLADSGQVAPGQTQFLRFVQDENAMTPIELQRWWLQRQRGRFRGSGRLARVPLASRIVDAAFGLSLAVRGTVPATTAAAADRRYETLVAEDPRRAYYGRVIRDGDWTVLQYHFFFAMNDWRSGFHGANDHEADWEQVHIYLYADELGRPTPRWVACASHDYEGDDLRRRWDDPALTIEGTHPVVFVGAGSHACYFEAGDYVLRSAPRFLVPVNRAVRAARHVWSQRLGQGVRESIDDEAEAEAAFSVPFVDYARGDGVGMGPGHDEPWTPLTISDAHGWVHRYRGLWGLDTRDRLGGERAPAGPKYNRDGRVRLSWHDPLGWSGIDTLYPPGRVLEETRARTEELTGSVALLEGQIEQSRRNVRSLAMDVEALTATSSLSDVQREAAEELASRRASLHALQAELTEVLETREALSMLRERRELDDWGSPTAHLRHPHHPAPPLPARRPLVDLWAALSGAVALLAFVVLVLFQPPYWMVLVLLVAVLVGAVEAIARGRFADYLLRIVVALAAVSGAILVWEFWRLLVVALLGILALYMIRDNLREAFER